MDGQSTSPLSLLAEAYASVEILLLDKAKLHAMREFMNDK